MPTFLLLLRVDLQQMLPQGLDSLVRLQVRGRCFRRLFKLCCLGLDQRGLRAPGPELGTNRLVFEFFPPSFVLDLLELTPDLVALVQELSQPCVQSGGVFAGGALGDFLMGGEPEILFSKSLDQLGVST